MLKEQYEAKITATINHQYDKVHAASDLFMKRKETEIWQKCRKAHLEAITPRLYFGGDLPITGETLQPATLYPLPGAEEMRNVKIEKYLGVVRRLNKQRSFMQLATEFGKSIQELGHSKVMGLYLAILTIK